MGVETSLEKKTYEESISIANAFDEIGFGVICIKTLSHAKHKVAMRVHPEKLRESGFDLCSYYYNEEN